MIDVNFIPHPLHGTPYGIALDLAIIFAIAATDQWINWTGSGFIALTLVFFGSTRLAESISLSRYPSYRYYQASTPRLIPFTRLGCIENNIEIRS